MPYEAPLYEKLHLDTANLKKYFDDNARRYAPPKYPILHARCLQLEEMYRKRAEAKPALFFKGSADPTYLGEIACIVQLVHSFPVTEPETLERHQVHNILLGALFYRRFSIEDYYSGLLSRALAYAGITNVRSSALYVTIDELLGLNDLNRLDDLTIATCCKAYLDHLRTIDAKIGSKFIHKDEVNFFTQLEKIVVEAEQRAQSIAKQLRYIVAIQAFGSMLRKTDAEATAGIDIFVEKISSKLKKENTLSHAVMVECLTTAKNLSPRVKAIISYLMKDTKMLKQETFQAFVDTTLKGGLVVYSKYILLGIYVFLLEGTLCSEGAFNKTLNEIMGIHSENKLDVEDRALMLDALAEYLELPEIDKEHDFRVWQSHELLVAQVNQQREELDKLLKNAPTLSASLVM